LSPAARQVLTVPQALHGVLLQDFLARSLPDADRARLRGIQARGGVRVNGMPAARNRRLLAFDHVELLAEPGDLAPRPKAAPAAPIAVLFASATALVVDKPAGLTTVPDRSGAEGGVHARLRELRSAGDLRIVHRLDRHTSGCLLLADGLAAAQHFDAAFRSHAVHKRYLALVHGAVARSEFAIDRWLGPDPRRPGRMLTSAAAKKGYRTARTRGEVVQALGDLTLLRLYPETGRSHQLRAHLAAIGHPIVGDADYGGRPLLLSEHKHGYKLRRGVAERPLLARPFLHSEQLEFVDVDGTPVTVDAPLPDDLRMALARLASHGTARARRG
jgi:RluA family pseudouridine synthase